MWWYVSKEKKLGPVPLDEVRILFQAGTIDADTLMWMEGMSEWEKFSQIEALKEIAQAVPPPVPKKTTPHITSFPFANRWRRFLARLFDVYWELMLVTYFLGMVIGKYSSGFLEWMFKPGSGLQWGIICLPVALLLDAVIYQVFGNTPGKAMLRVHVRGIDGSKLPFSEYFRRNLHLWTFGFALGFPLVNLFTMYSQSNRLERGAQASYDEKNGWRAWGLPTGLLRNVAFALSFFLLMGLIGVLKEQDRQVIAKVSESNSASEYAWENPLTKRQAKIAGIWNYENQTKDGEQSVFMFSEPTNHASVVFAMQKWKGSIRQYVDSFRKGTESNMRFGDGGLFHQLDGRDSWRGEGVLKTIDSENRISVTISRDGESFWRIVRIQVPPYEYSDAKLDTLMQDLWLTTK